MPQNTRGLTQDSGADTLARLIKGLSEGANPFDLRHSNSVARPANSGPGFGETIYGPTGISYRAERQPHGLPARSPVNPLILAFMSQFAQSMNPTPPDVGGMFGGTNPTSAPAPLPPAPPLNVPTPTPQSPQSAPPPTPVPQATPESMIPWLSLRR